jgi:molecular chaperone HscB
VGTPSTSAEVRQDPFELLGLAARYDLDLAELEARHRELVRALHPDRFRGRSASERRQALGKAIEVNEALRALKDPVRRAEALLERRGVAIGEGSEPPADPEFLLEVMEFREALRDAQKCGDAQRVEVLCEDVKRRQEQAEREFTKGLGATDRAPATRLVALLGELRYYRRFFAEAHAILDELS